jgi:hypothetical protein
VIWPGQSASRSFHRMRCSRNAAQAPRSVGWGWAGLDHSSWRSWLTVAVIIAAAISSHTPHRCPGQRTWTTDPLARMSPPGVEACLRPPISDCLNACATLGLREEMPPDPLLSRAQTPYAHNPATVDWGQGSSSHAWRNACRADPAASRAAHKGSVQCMPACS